MWSADAGLLALDLDGTLIDARRRQLSVLVSVIHEREMDRIVPNLFWELKREGRSTVTALMSLDIAEGEAETTAERWVDRVEDESELLQDKLIPGVENDLAALAACGVRPTVVTARKHPDRALQQFGRLGLNRWCEGPHVVEAGPEAATRKAEILRDLGAAAYVGDTESDAKAASLAGVPFAAVATGQRSPAFLSAKSLTPHLTLSAAIGALPRS